MLGRYGWCIIVTLLCACFVEAKTKSDSILTYTAPAKLVEYEDCETPGFHPREFDKTNPVRSHTYEDGVGIITFSAPLTYLCSYAFYKDSTIQTVELPSSVTQTGSNVFYECKNLRKVYFPKKLEQIGSCFCCFCASLDSVYLYDPVTKIESSAFSNCSSLSEVRLPSNYGKLSTIGTGAFSKCKSLFSIDIPLTVTSIGAGAFSGICNVIYHGDAAGRAYWGHKVLNGYPDYPLVYDASNQTILACAYDATDTICLGVSDLYIGAKAFKDCQQIKAIRMRRVYSIGDEAFKNCSSLTLLYTGSHLSIVGDEVFGGCDSLQTVWIESPDLIEGEEKSSYLVTTPLPNLFGESVKNYIVSEEVSSIGRSAFKNGTGVEQVYLHDSIESIGMEAFSGCTALKEVHLPLKTTLLNSNLFYDCTSLEHLVIPSRVETIGHKTFMNCTGLQSITSYAQLPPVCQYDTFDNVDKKTPLWVPKGTEDAYSKAMGWARFWENTHTIPTNENTTIIPCHSDNKVLKDGQLFIQQNGRVYTILGERVE